MTDFAQRPVQPRAFSVSRIVHVWRTRHINKISAAVAVTAFGILSFMMLDGEPPVRFQPDVRPFLDAPAMVKVHVLSAVTAFIIGCVLLTGVKGNAMHRSLGYTWVAAMAATAISSFMLSGPIGSFFSLIHVLSAWTLIVLPMGVAAARRGNVATHAKRMTGMFVGGMLIAGLFTFLPGRLMWHLLFST